MFVFTVIFAYRIFMSGKEQPSNITYRIHVRGLVQGVGFRPFIYKLALEHGLNGSVENRNDGVFILVNCSNEKVLIFIADIHKKAPPASNIDSITHSEVDHIPFTGFEIVKSASVSDTITDVSPDIAVCDDCLKDMKTQPNRIDYPFINCTNCGPRFTIIKDLPYDREKTTMKEFEMCPDCRREYTDVLDRRFHAQPVACSVCGPEYTLFYGNEKIYGSRNILPVLAQLLSQKKIVAIKGLGGFFLACDAFCEETVARLRKLKNREGKPFAVMFRDIDSLKEYAFVDDNEERVLTSLKRPIVILKQKKELAPSVAVGFNTIGAMLPYMPLHHLMFGHIDTPAVVLTSGNLSDEPILINNDDALKTFNGIADAVLTYNRDIHNRADDSVVTVVNKKEMIFRRSRGYVPTPLNLQKNVDGILATGAELVNCFCIGRDNQAIISQHIGDLKNLETYEFFTGTIEKFKRLYRLNPGLVVSDMHPDYLSTQYATQSGIPHVKVQHHHAHIVSCMAEHNLDEDVIGVAMDGTGLGDDGKIWGSEFLICNPKNYRRINHFAYMPMPGGDKVTSEPWRMAVSYLYEIYGDGFRNFDLPFLKNIPADPVGLLCNAIDKKINSPLSSGAGRLFDAVAALINLCPVSKFHAEAPMRLEAVLNPSNRDHYHFEFTENGISFHKTIIGIVDDMKTGRHIADISAKFHNTIITVIAQTVKEISSNHNLNKVVLSGGTFQNKYLLENIENELLSSGFSVYSHSKVPTNDAGIALGQLVIASTR